MAVRQQKKKSVVRISDTTLRDGCQTPGVRLDPEAKVRIAVALADAGFHSIDVGFPAAGPSEVEAIQRIAKVVKRPVLSAHSRTLPEDIDLAAQALSGVSPLKRAVTLFIGTGLARPIGRQARLARNKRRHQDEAGRRRAARGSGGQPLDAGLVDRGEIGRLGGAHQARTMDHRLDAIDQALETFAVLERPRDERGVCRTPIGAANQGAHAPAVGVEPPRHMAADETGRAGYGDGAGINPPRRGGPMRLLGCFWDCLKGCLRSRSTPARRSRRIRHIRRRDISP